MCEFIGLNKDLFYSVGSFQIRNTFNKHIIRHANQEDSDLIGSLLQLALSGKFETYDYQRIS